MEIRLLTEPSASMTEIPNYFIERFMPLASGEYVKVYLYLLYTIQHGKASFSVDAAADLLNHTENDICRALRYFEKEGLLCLESASDGSILSLKLSVPTGVTASGILTDRKTTVHKEEAVSKASSPAHSLSRARLMELQNDKDVQQLLFIIEQYMGQTLTLTHIEKILYLHDVLHFSLELLEYLAEYCVSKGGRSIRYMESVGLAWHESGITTVTQAREMTDLYNKQVFSIFKSFGIKGRNPIPTELAFIKKWTDEYGFTTEIIAQACTRTISQIHQPSFEYADKILSSWKKQGVKHLSDISRLDTAYKSGQQKQTAKPVDSNNKFNNFEQRSYDYIDLERRLLQANKP